MVGGSAGWQEVGDRCFRRRYEHLDLNIGLIIGSEGAVVLDTRCDDLEAAELIDHVSELTATPVRWVVNSHAHFDHCFGNARFAQLRPTPEFWAHERVPGWLEEFGEISRHAHADRMTDPVAAGALRDVSILAPDHLVVDRATLDLGDRRIDLRYPGRGHTDNDLVVVVDDAEVIYAGDIIEESADPAYGDDSFPLDWSSSVATMQTWATADTVVIPGHGDLMSHERTAAQHTDLRRCEDLIRVAHQAELSAAEAVEDLAASWPFEAGLATAVERGFAQLDARPGAV